MTATKPSFNTGRLLIAAAISGVIAAVGNLIVYFIAGGAGVPMQVMAPGSSGLQALPAAPVIISSIIPAFGAAGVLALLTRFTARPVLIFQIIAAVFLLLSFSGPLGMPTDGGTKLVLNLMHVVAGVAITLGLTRASRVQ